MALMLKMMIARQAMVDIQIIHYIPFADSSQFSAASHRTRFNNELVISSCHF
jgi:hypothetical protein